jgi:hypothetical protein
MLSLVGWHAAHAQSPLFDLFQKSCLEHSRSPVDAEAAARALGLTDTNRPSKADPAKSITSADLTTTIDDNPVVIAVYDEPFADTRRRMHCGLYYIKPDEALLQDLRSWAGFAPAPGPDGDPIYLFGAGKKVWTPLAGGNAGLKAAIDTGDLRAIEIRDEGCCLSIVLTSFRWDFKPPN